MRHVAYKTWAQGRLTRKSSPSTAPPLALPRKSSPSKRKNADFGVFRACRANFFALAPAIRPSRANFFAHKARQRSDIETNNTTAHPQQGSLETGITSAPEKCTKNTHLAPAKATLVSVEPQPAPAKAMAVSVTARPAPAKAMAVSDSQAAWSTGPGCGARGQWCGSAAAPAGGRRYKRRQTGAM